MEIKLELDGIKYEGNVEKVSSDKWPVYKTLVDNEIYYWMLAGNQNWRMFTSTEQMRRYGYDPESIDLIAPPDFFRKYPIYGIIEGRGEIPSFFYEWPWQGEPNQKTYPFKGLRGLLTLNPKPTKQQIIDLGFNTMMPYSGSVDWQGDYISITKDRPGPVVLRYTGDERDCHKQDPQSELELLEKMKRETPDIPVGFNLNCSIGCGVEGTCETIAEYKKEWIKVANQADYVSLNIYPHRSRKGWAEDPIAVMERFWKEWKDWGITIPVIPVIQAHWTTHDLIKPDPMPQVKFWFDKGLTGYVVYCWADANHGVRDMQNEWKEANKWAKNNI